MCKSLFYNKLKTIDDISNIKCQLDIKQDRKNIKIAVIDDKRDFFKDDFEKTGFIDITINESFDGPKQYEPFDLILCDIDGVAIEKNDKTQGVSVAKTLKQMYPNKIIVLYSGRRPEEFDREYYKYVDDYFNKSLSATELADKIADLCKIFWDPREAWMWTRKQLVKNGQSTKSIAWLEDSYVNSFLKRENKVDEELLRKIKIGTQFASLLIRVITTILFK